MSNKLTVRMKNREYIMLMLELGMVADLSKKIAEAVSRMPKQFTDIVKPIHAKVIHQPWALDKDAAEFVSEFGYDTVIGRMQGLLIASDGITMDEITTVIKKLGPKDTGDSLMYALVFKGGKKQDKYIEDPELMVVPIEFQISDRKDRHSGVTMAIEVAKAEDNTDDFRPTGKIYILNKSQEIDHELVENYYKIMEEQ